MLFSMRQFFWKYVHLLLFVKDEFPKFYCCFVKKINLENSVFCFVNEQQVFHNSGNMKHEYESEYISGRID